MKKFTNQQIEMISTSAINLLLCNFQDITPDINWNDKEPSWDGNIYLYENNSSQKKFLKGKIPVQVKGTEVKRFNRRFHSFQIAFSDIKNYYHNGGVLFLVVEIMDTDNFKIFYKFLLPMELNELIDDMKNNTKDSKAVHLDNILDKDTPFSIECNEFLIHRAKQSVPAVENAVNLEQVKDKTIEIVGNNIFNMIGKDIYSYAIDEFGMSVPIKNKMKLLEVSYKIEKDCIIDNKKYFDNFEIVNREDSHIQVLGDGFEFDSVNKTITLKSSTKDIVTRLNTLEFIENAIDNKKSKCIQEQLKEIEEEKNLILQIIDVCEKFNIPKDNIKLCEMTVNDIDVLKILQNIKLFSQAIKNDKELQISVQRFDFFGYKILLLCISDNENKNYVNYFEKDEEFDLIATFDKKCVSIGRFCPLSDLDLLVSNFDINILKKSIKMVNDRCDESDKAVLSSQYNFLALEAIKAWDISNNNIYFDLANYIFDIFKNYIDSNIIYINKAQIEKRMNGKLHEKTIENLYKIKFSECEKSDSDNALLTAIDILLENEESFKKHFQDIEDKQRFMDYPIYTLYSKKNS